VLPTSGGGLPGFTGLNCTAPLANVGDTKYEIGAIGNLPAGGGTLSGASGSWTKFTIASATPFPVYTPVPGTTNPPTIPIYVYLGTYTVTSATAPTTGCFYLVTTTDGSPLSSGGATSAAGVGIPNLANYSSGYALTSVSHGSLTTIGLTVSATSGSGTFTLDNGDSGTISLSSRIQATTTQAIRRMQPTL
jgi:hypothetical protein